MCLIEASPLGDGVVTFGDGVVGTLTGITLDIKSSNKREGRFNTSSSFNVEVKIKTAKQRREILYLLTGKRYLSLYQWRKIYKEYKDMFGVWPAGENFYVQGEKFHEE